MPAEQGGLLRSALLSLPTAAIRGLLAATVLGRVVDAATRSHMNAEVSTSNGGYGRNELDLD